MTCLHIGGEIAHDDWQTLNVKDADYQQDARDLSNFADGSVDSIYASHILEHFHYLLNGELQKLLAEWYRVLVPGGQLMLSVPDLAELCRMFLELGDPSNRYHVMRIMFGGQTDKYDVHKVGFDLPILTTYLAGAGFSSVERVESFGLFQDCSELELWGHRISLNVTARK